MLALLEIIALLAFLVTFYSQVIIPLYRNTPLFPIFREGPGLSIKLAEEREKLFNKKLKADIRRLQK